MPPKARFTKEQVVEAALNIIREESAESLTARALGKKLGSSACPIFTVYESMEEVKRDTVKAARALYREYVKKGLSEKVAFKGVGTQYILFAMNEPKLFQLLFMTEQDAVPGIGSVLPLIDESYESILSSITSGYGVKGAAAEKLYRHLWIYTHGIAALCATKMCSFSGEEISEMMTEVFVSLLDKVKGEQDSD